MSDSFYRPLEQRIASWARPEGPLVQATGTQFALGTEKGPVRKDNQDRVVFLRIASEGQHASVLRVGVLCDGMGGMIEGARCAELAVGAFAATVIQGCGRLEPVPLLAQAAEAANVRVHDNVGGKGGATLSAILLRGDAVFMCHVGDSRVYSVSPNGSLRQESTDDTIQAQLDAMGAASSHPSSDHQSIVQFVGMGADLQPHISRLDVPLGSKLIVMSDGAYRPSASLFEQLARNSETPLELIQRLLALARWLGGHDNASALSVFAKAESERDVRMDRSLVEVWSPTGKLEILLMADRGGPTIPPRHEVSDPRLPPVPQRPAGGTRRKGRGRNRERGQAQLPMGADKGKLSIEVKKQADSDVDRAPPRAAEVGNRSQPGAKDGGGNATSGESPNGPTPADRGEGARPNLNADRGTDDGGSRT